MKQKLENKTINNTALMWVWSDMFSANNIGKSILVYLNYWSTFWDNYF